MSHTHFIGLMSGTSLDGVDGVLADFSGEHPAVLADAYVDKVLLRAAPATVSGYKKRPRADPHRRTAAK